MEEQQDMIGKQCPPTVLVHYAEFLLSTFPDWKHRTAQYPCQRQSIHLHNRQSSLILVMSSYANYLHSTSLGYRDSSLAQCARETGPKLSKLSQKIKTV